MAEITYLKDPREIYDASFKIIEKEAQISAFPENIKPIVKRIIHACGMIDIAEKIRFNENITQKAVDALNYGKPILVDCEMMRAAINQKMLPNHNKILCTLNHPKTEKYARDKKMTKSAAALNLWEDHMEDAIIAIGNAPTALFALLEKIAPKKSPKPAAIFAFPVGFIGAEEAKESLIRNHHTVPFITLKGRQGGSAMAAAAVNATAILAQNKTQK